MNKLMITVSGGVVQKVTANFDTKDLEIIINDLDNIEAGDTAGILLPDYDADEIEKISASILY